MKTTIDAIYTGSDGDALCCLAVKHGFGYGLNSSRASRLCLYAQSDRMREHRVCFVDNEFKRYDHARHLEVVARLRPKYATVIDVMSREQCAAYNARYYTLDQILRYAEELKPHCDHVMVIPKIDCVADIPPEYMLGYSTPTSYGGTDLPYSAFAGRPVHVLGGAWQQIRDAIRAMNVVSFDIAHIHKIAKAGLFVDGYGHQYRLAEVMPSFSHNPLYTCMALSFAAIRAELNRIEHHAAV